MYLPRSAARSLLHCVALLIAALLLAQPSPRASAATSQPRAWLPLLTLEPASGSVPAFKHIFTIVLENTAYDTIMQSPDAPYFQALAAHYGLSDSYYGVRHPSLPNYLALIGGDTFGITSDCTSCTVDAPNLVDQLETAGHSWKAYLESMPSACFAGNASPLYMQKHNPFIYFDNVRTNPARCARLVPLTQLTADLASGQVPDYVWITPNMCNSLHDCGIKTGDDWLRAWVEPILASPAWQDQGVLFITFDESDQNNNGSCCQYGLGGQIATLVISPLGRPAYRSPRPYSHYSLLRTIEAAWGMPPLANSGCACSQPMVDFFVQPGSVPAEGQ
jgi:hypothetical protein